jgi:hypothetical protein
MIKIKKKYLEAIIDGLSDKKLKEWKSEDSRPAVVNEPTIEMEPAIISPKSETQVSDEELPINDPEWVPGNPHELGMAMRQLSEMVPESETEWFYARLRNLIDKAIDRVDEERMQPRVDEE